MGLSAMTGRGVVTLVALAIAVLALVGIGVDASARRAARAREQAAIVAMVRLLPGDDLAISGGARHLRYVSLEEPGAAFADLPAMLDAEPAGGAIAPPTGAWIDETKTSRARTMEKQP